MDDRIDIPDLDVAENVSQDEQIGLDIKTHGQDRCQFTFLTVGLRSRMVFLVAMEFEFSVIEIT